MFIRPIIKATFTTASISDPNIATLINGLQSDQILLLSLGVLPKKVFDGLYTYQGSNSWPAIHEGANTFNTLVLSGKPFFSCTPLSMWRIPLINNVDPAVIQQLDTLYSDFCAYPSAWGEHSDAYLNLGKAIVDANDPQSKFALYFKQVQIEARKQENDRTYQSLKKVLELSMSSHS